MANIFCDEKHVFAYIIKKNNIIELVPFYTKEQYLNCSQNLRKTLNNMQDCIQEYKNNKDESKIFYFATKVTQFDIELKQLEEQENITRVYLQQKQVEMEK